MGLPTPAANIGAQPFSYDSPDDSSMSLIGFAGLWQRTKGDDRYDHIRALKPLRIADTPVDVP